MFSMEDVTCFVGGYPIKGDTPNTVETTELQSFFAPNRLMRPMIVDDSITFKGVTKAL